MRMFDKTFTGYRKALIFSFSILLLSFPAMAQEEPAMMDFPPEMHGEEGRRGGMMNEEQRQLRRDERRERMRMMREDGNNRGHRRNRRRGGGGMSDSDGMLGMFAGNMSEPLSADAVKAVIKGKLALLRNKNLTVGKVEVIDDEFATVQITTVDGSLVQNITINRMSGEIPMEQ